MVADRPDVGPIEKVASGVAAQPVRDRSDPDSSQVEPVSVPACLKGGVTCRQAVGVQTAGFEQHLEPVVIEMN